MSRPRLHAPIQHKPWVARVSPCLYLFSQPCTLFDIPHKWDEEHWYVTYTGPVYAGKYFSEWFLLNYLNGMDYAWGELR